MYRWVEHTSEVELEIDSAQEANVFSEAVMALAELLDADPRTLPTHQRSLTLANPERALLFAEWLEELVYLAESEGFVALLAPRLRLEPDRVEADVAGVFTDPPHLVKAVTLHRLLFARGGSGYVARVVLDV